MLFYTKTYIYFSFTSTGARRNAEGGLRNRGSVRIFKRVSQEWTQVAELDGEDQGDQFGYSCSISGDGKIVAVGIPGEDSNGKNTKRHASKLDITNVF